MRLDTRAFAIVGGLVTSGTVFLLTLAAQIGPGDVTAPWILERTLFGYSVTPEGAFIGALWSFAYGWLGSGVFAFLYNLLAAPKLPPPRTDG